MSESAEHRRLVERILAHIEDRCGDTDALVVFDDRSGVVGEKPPRIDRFTPDVYAYDTPNNMTVIGEAKTISDLRSERSREQLSSFLGHLEFRQNGCLLLAVPWSVADEARTLVSKLQVEILAKSVAVTILDGVPARTPAEGVRLC